MIRDTARAGWLIAVMLAVALPLSAQEANVPVQEVTLANGMTLLMVERHDTPTVAAGWVAHVGSANERPGITGIAHLFEHMMFKGTKTIGTSDYAEEKQILDRLDGIFTDMEQEYEKLRWAKRRGEISGSVYAPENQTPRLAELRGEMTKLQEQEHALIVKDEFDKIYTANGGSFMNAFTNTDMTTFFVIVPANKLELWCWMESDRLANLVLREFYSERDVVREERRMRVESDPVAKFEEQYEAVFWTSIPYHHPIVGWPSDVEAINREQAEDFFNTYYAPNNLTAVLVGDFDAKNAAALVQRYFGRIPRGAKNPPPMITEEVPQLSERRLSARAETNPTVEIRWQGAPFVHKDAPALSVLTDLLDGRTGRLYKALVEEKGLATGEPYAIFQSMKYDGFVEIGAEVADGHTHQEVEAALRAEVARLAAEPVPPEELEKVKNQNAANSFRRLQSNFYLMIQLLVFDAMGDWHALNDRPAQVAAVTAEDVKRVADTYFPADGATVMWYSRKEGSTEDPELAAVPAQARPMVKQALSQIAASTDPDQLRGLIGQVRAGMGQAPPAMKPALELIISRAEARIAAIEAAGKGE